MSRHRILRRAAVAIVLALVVGAAGSDPVPAFVAAQLDPPEGPVSWLSAGDSYASGEGATGATGVCQQTPVAWGPRTALLLGDQRAWDVRPEHGDFTACTGAKMADVPAPDGQFDAITLSIGGNDIDFDATVKDCLGIYPEATDSWAEVIAKVGDGRCQVTEDDLRNRVDRLLEADPGLVTFWRQMAQDHLTERGVLVIAGYPRLATPSRYWGAWRGERCNTIHRDDADMLGRAAAYFDQRMRTAVDGLRAEGLRVSYASRLAVFDDGGEYHSLCARGVEWINTVFLFLRTTGRMENGFHPNDLGHLATAEHAAALVEEAMGTRAVTVTSLQPEQPRVTPPPITSGQPTFEIGEPFQRTCTVAWPTAPYRSNNSIQMRMTCPGVPSQFLFVDVTYGDPDLPVNPSDSTVQISGTIADIARSEMGFTVLVVLANRARVL